MVSLSPRLPPPDVVFQLLCKDIGCRKKTKLLCEEDEQRTSVQPVRRAMKDNAATGCLGTLVLRNASASLEIDSMPVVAKRICIS